MSGSVQLPSLHVDTITKSSCESTAPHPVIPVDRVKERTVSSVAARALVSSVDSSSSKKRRLLEEFKLPELKQSRYEIGGNTGQDTFLKALAQAEATGLHRCDAIRDSFRLAYLSVAKHPINLTESDSTWTGPPMYVRDPEDFTGNTLIIGCGHNTNVYTQQCEGHSTKDCYLVCLEPENWPDMLADCNTAAFWKMFKDEKFTEIFLEGFGLIPQEDVLKEMARVLKAGGRVRMGNYPVLEVEEKIDSLYKACGFSSYRTIKEIFRSVTERRERDMLHLYK
jgi:hypothetical protein